MDVVPSGAFDEITALDVNDAEQIVFGGVGQGAARVYRTGPAGGTFTPVADGHAVAVAINDHGLLAALFAADGAGPERIRFGPSLATPVIAVGDALLGSTVTDVDFANQGFNDANQIAFLATLADGRGGIYVASPVPEPGMGSLTSSALAMLIRPRRARAGSPRAENPVRDAVTTRTAYPRRTELCAR